MQRTRPVMAGITPQLDACKRLSNIIPVSSAPIQADVRLRTCGAPSTAPRPMRPKVPNLPDRVEGRQKMLATEVCIVVSVYVALDSPGQESNAGVKQRTDFRGCARAQLSGRAATLNADNRALRNGTQCFVIIGKAENLAPTDCLRLACMHDAGSCDERVAFGRPHIVDLELGGDDGWPQHETTRKGESIVSRVGNDAAVNEPVLLLDLLGHRQAKFNAVSRELDKFGVEQPAEWLRLQYLPCGLDGYGHHSGSP